MPWQPPSSSFPCPAKALHRPTRRVAGWGVPSRRGPVRAPRQRRTPRLGRRSHSSVEREEGDVEIGRLTHHFVGVQGAVTAVDGHEQGATRDQHSRHLRERSRDLRPGDVDQCVEADDAGERAVGKVQRGHVSLGKRQRGEGEARLRHHAGREVDAHGIDTVPGEEGADVSRAASEVADGVALSRTPCVAAGTGSGSRGRTACGPARGGIGRRRPGPPCRRWPPGRPTGSGRCHPRFLNHPSKGPGPRPGGPPWPPSRGGGRSRVLRRTESDPRPTMQTTTTMIPITEAATATGPSLCSRVGALTCGCRGPRRIGARWVGGDSRAHGTLGRNARRDRQPERR